MNSFLYIKLVIFGEEKFLLKNLFIKFSNISAGGVLIDFANVVLSGMLPPSFVLQFLRYLISWELSGGL